jgi:hypothetical protein
MVTKFWVRNHGTHEYPANIPFMNFNGQGHSENRAPKPMGAGEKLSKANMKKYVEKPSHLQTNLNEENGKILMKVVVSVTCTQLQA